MVFDPNVPSPNDELDAVPIRDNFNALKQLTDEALKLDQTQPQQVTGGAPVFAEGVNVGGVAQLTRDDLGNGLARGLLTLKNDSEQEWALSPEDIDKLHQLDTGYNPAVPGHWTDPAPTSLAEAIDRLAAKLSQNGQDPV